MMTRLKSDMQRDESLTDNQGITKDDLNKILEEEKRRSEEEDGDDGLTDDSDNDQS